jgi:2-polyprenyl-3-methyl-5-hydroxy-6-metoxy-1,4-benzoquinol methylase
MMDFEQQEEMKEYYDESGYFDDKIQTDIDLLKGSFQKYRISKVLQMYSPAKEEHVLDLGCALGTFCFALAPLCKQITGVDYSKKAIDFCNKFLETSQCSNLKFVCADATNTGLTSESYDVIICADLLEHLYPEVSDKVLDECRRLLKKGGKLVIWTPHRGHILEILKNNNIILKRDVSHVDYKSMDNLLEGLRKRDFTVQKSYYAESHIPVFRILERLLIPVLPLFRRRIAILAEKRQ